MIGKKKAISRVQAIVVIVIVVIAAVAAGVAYSLSSTPPMSSSSVTATSLSTQTSSTSTLSTLVVDDWNWPLHDLNQLYSVFELPWPNWLQYTVYQSLVNVNETTEYSNGTIQYIPGLASNWTVSADGTTYTFNLLQNVHFSNGDPLNAYQVWMEMYAFYYLSGNSSAFLESYPVLNMTGVNFGPSTIALINQTGGLINPSQQALSIMRNSSWPIYVTGPYQIVFRLKAPFLWFLGLLVVYDGLLFDTQWALDHGGFGTPTSFNSYFNQNPIPGTGSYIVTGVSENSYVKFTQDASYWGKNLTQAQLALEPVFDPGHVKNVIVNYKADDLARYTDLSTGAAQISAILTSDWNLVLANPDKYSYLALTPASLLMTFLSFNTQIYPTNITDVRQAIVHGINYTDISQKAFFGQTTPIVGPEYPAYKKFYDLGNLSPYQYNLTLAKEYLAKSNITNFPVLTFEVVSGNSYASAVAQTVQADLAAIGITVNIEAVAPSLYYTPLGSYSTDLMNKAQIPQILLQNGVSWAPSALTPADDWVDWVSNQSSWGDTAIYANPVVQKCVNSFTSSNNVSYIQSLCTSAQAQIYNDAPYAWLGVNLLWDSAGSLVWQKGVIKSFLLDPAWGGQNTAPLFNTVMFGP